MDIDRVRAIASNPALPRRQLEQMLQNVRVKGDSQAIAAVEEIYKQRFGQMTGLDRADPATAAIVLERMYPNGVNRQAVINRLVRSISVANATAPGAWAVTLTQDYFRLNVGQVEVLVGYSDGFFLNCSASTDAAPFNANGFEDAHYASIPNPQCRFRGKPAQLRKLTAEVCRAHERFVHLAALTPSGKPRAGTPFRKAHSEGLVKYARQVSDAANGSA